MASRGVSYWRWMAGQVRYGTAAAAAATAPRMKPYAPTASDFMDHHQGLKKGYLRGEFVPVYVGLGMIMLSMSMGLHSAKQQLAHSPGVWVSKKKRESIPEVEEPEVVASHSDKFINNSSFRRVAHVQDLDDPFHRPRHLETLKSVGVDPHAH